MNAKQNFLQRNYDGTSAPSKSDLIKMWRSTSIDVLSVNPPPGLQPFLTAWGGLLVNGGVIYVRFSIPNNPILGWYVSRNRIDECGLLDRIIQTAIDTPGLPEFQELKNPLKKVLIVEPLMLDGVLAHKLVWGGAYQSFRGRESKAKDLGIAASESLISNRYSWDDVFMYESYDAWSTWFHGIAWDWTLFVVDKHAQELTLLAGTDTD